MVTVSHGRALWIILSSFYRIASALSGSWPLNVTVFLTKLTSSFFAGKKKTPTVAKSQEVRRGVREEYSRVSKEPLPRCLWVLLLHRGSETRRVINGRAQKNQNKHPGKQQHVKNQVTKHLSDVLQMLQKLTSFPDHLGQENELLITGRRFYTIVQVRATNNTVSNRCGRKELIVVSGESPQRAFYNKPALILA